MDLISKKLIDLLLKIDKYNDGDYILEGLVIADALSCNSELLTAIESDETLSGAFVREMHGVKYLDSEKLSFYIKNKEFLPNSYTEFETMGLVDSNNKFIVDKEGNPNDVSLVWSYKDCILAGGQTKEEYDNSVTEVFYNEKLAISDIDRLLSPKVLSNMKRYDITGVSIVKDGFDIDNDNLIIKGNNLLALHSIYNVFKGKIKLIYIDIPYNTQTDSFKYNDSFTHSTWLTFIKNRLEVARELLKNDGSIFIQCDDNEMAYLKVLCDEIFGRDNFVNSICVQMSSLSGEKMAHVEKRFPKIKEYLLVYKKGAFKIKPVKVRKKKWDTEYNTFFKEITLDDYIKISENKLSEHDLLEINSKLSDSNVITLDDAFKLYNIKKNDRLAFCIENAYRIARSSNSNGLKKELDRLFDTTNGFNQTALIIKYKDGYSVCKTNYDRTTKDPRVQYVFAKDTLDVPVGDIWYDITTSGLHSEGGVSLPKGQKPEELLERIIECATEPKDIVLDFFLGSGTTCAVAHKMNRRYIGVEQMDYIEELAVSRLKNVINGDKTGVSSSVHWEGGGSFVYCELLKLNESYVNQIRGATSNNTLMDIYGDILKNAFLHYKYDINNLEEKEGAFSDKNIQEKKEFLMKILDKNMLYVNYCDMEDVDYKVKSIDKINSKLFYEGGNLIG